VFAVLAVAFVAVLGFIDTDAAPAGGPCGPRR
jgi:hypothetical protein